MWSVPACHEEHEMRELLARILEPLVRALDIRERAVVPVVVRDRHPRR